METAGVWAEALDRATDVLIYGLLGVGVGAGIVAFIIAMFHVWQDER